MWFFREEEIVEILNQEDLNDAGAAEIIKKKYGLLSNTIIPNIYSYKERWMLNYYLFNRYH